MIITTKNKELAILGKTLSETQGKLIEFFEAFERGGIKGQDGIIDTFFSKDKKSPLTPELLANFKNFKEQFNSSSLSAEALAEQIENVDQRIIDYAKTCKNGEMTTEGFKESIDKTGKVALQAFAMTGNMIAMWAITKCVKLAVKGIDNLIHSAEHCKERVDELMSSYKFALDEVNNNAKTIRELTSEYIELSEGVDGLGKNINLTEEEFSRYHDIVNKIAEISPELVDGWDAQKNAIINLKGNVNALTESYKKAQIEAYNTIINGTDGKNGADEIIKNYQNVVNGSGEYSWRKAGYSELLEIANRYKNVNSAEQLKEIMGSVKEEYYYTDLWGTTGFENMYDELGLSEIISSPILYNNLTDEQAKEVSKNVSTYVLTLQSEIESELNKMNTLSDAYLNLFLLQDEDYKNIDENVQAALSKIVISIDTNTIESLGLDSPKAISLYIQSLLDAVSTGEEAEKVSQTLIDLFSLDPSDLQPEDAKKLVDQYISYLAPILGQSELELKGRLGFDNVDDLVANYKNTIHDIAKQASGVSDVELRRENGKYSDYKEIYDRIDAFADEYSINTQDEIAAFNQAFEKAEYDIDKAFKLYLQNLTDDNNFTPSISSSVEQIARQLEPQFAKLGDAYSSIFSENGFHLDAVDNPMLENLRESFAEIDEEIGVTFDTDKINEFFDVLENGTSTAEDIKEAESIVQDAFNDLATAYFYATDTLENLNKETAQSIKHQLEQMGIANSEEVIDHYLTLAEAESSLIEIQNRLADAQKELAESSNTGEYMSAQRNIEAVYAQMEAFYNEKGATEELRTALFNLQLQQANLDINSINTTASCQQLINLAKYAGLSGEYMERLLDLQDLISLYHSTTNGNMQSAMQPQINAAKQELEDLLNAPLDLTFDFPNGKSSDAGSGTGSVASSAGKDAAQEYLEGFNKECDRLKFLRDNSIITEKEYLDQLRVLYEKYFKDREEYLEEYVKYEREYLNGLKSLYENALSGITGLLDKQMEKIEEERDAKIDALEEEQDARSKALELQKEQLDLQIEEIESQIKVKDAAIDAINDEIDAIKKANDERQRQIDLQKSLYNLERMQNQRTILQYSEDKGMHYVSDTSGIRDAKQSVDDAKMEIEIAGKEKQISLIEDEISLLESRKTLLEDQQTSIDQQIEALDEFYQKLIANTETYYSALIDPIEQYKAQFASIAEIESDAAFGEQLNSLGYSANDILALSSSTLENFKSNYLGILSDIYAGNTQMLDSISMVSGFNGENLVGYLSQSQPYIDSLARLDLTSTQTAIDSANSGIYSFADGAVLATANITTMAETTTTLLEGDKKHAGIISSFATMASVLTDANNQIAGITSGMEELDGKTATIKINIETNGDTSLLGSAYASGSAPAGDRKSVV